MSIATQCMTVNLQVGMWVGQRLDKQASDRVTEDAGAVQDAARVNKHLIPKDVIKPIQQAANAIRAHVYTHTLPWKDNGDRLLTRQMYMDFMPAHAALVQEFGTAVEHFLDEAYPAAVAQASFRMGSLFNRDDYPSADQLRHKFYVNLDVDAVTEAGDFRVELDEAEMTRVRTDIDTKLRQRIGSAMTDVWTRLADTLGHFATKLGDTDAIFRDSTVKNLEELVELLPGLNVLNDAQLEQIRQDVASKLTGIAPKDLRKDATLRRAVAKDAQDIMSKMQGFMNAFGGGAA
jgi:hypothetical protein